MKILRVMGTPSFNYGSQERYLVKLSKMLKESGHQSFLVYENQPQSSHFIEEAKSNGAHFFQVTPRRSLEFFFRNSIIAKILKLWYNVFDIFSIIKIMKIIKENNIDIVHSYFSPSIYAVFAGKLMGKRTFRTIGNPFLQPAKYHGKKINWLFDMKCKLIHIWPINFLNFQISISESINKEYIYYKADKKKLKIIRTGVDTEKYNPLPIKKNKLRKQYGLENKFILGFTGRLDRQKNPLFLLELMKYLDKSFSDIVLVLVGDGELHEKIKSKAMDQGISDKVILTGRRHDIPNMLIDFDLFILPSIFEGGPGSLLEAMSMEKICITSKLEVFDEIINDGFDGYTRDLNNVKEFAKLITNIKQNPSLVTQVGKRARNNVLDNWNVDKRVKQTLAIYEVGSNE